MIYYGAIIRDSSILVYYNYKSVAIKDYSLLNFLTNEKQKINENPTLFNKNEILDNSSIICNKINNLKNDFYILLFTELDGFDIINNNINKLFSNLVNEISNNYKNILLMGNVDIYFSKLLKRLIDNYNNNHSNNNKLIIIENDINDLEELAIKKFDTLINRGNDLNTLKFKAENIQKTTFNVLKNSKKLKNKFLFEKYKNYIIFISCLLVILLLYFK